MRINRLAWLALSEIAELNADPQYVLFGFSNFTIYQNYFVRTR